MDCEKLRADIEQLREARDAFKSAADETIETGLGNTKCNERLKQASEIEDKVLENYLEKFAEKNSELFELEYAGSVEGLEDVGGSILYLGDDKILEYLSPNNGGGIVIYQKQSDGSYEVLQSFDDSIVGASGAELLSDGNILLKNSINTEIYGFLRKSEDGSYEFERFEDYSWEKIESVLALSDGSVLTWGIRSGGSFYDSVDVSRYRVEEPGYSSGGLSTVTLGPGSEMIDEAYSMIELSNGDILVSDGDGKWGTLTINRDEWTLYETYEFQSQDLTREQVTGSIRRAFDLPNGDFVICTGSGEFSVIRKGDDGRYSYVSDARSLHLIISTSDSVQCDNGDVLILGSDGSVVPYVSKDSGFGFAAAINKDDTFVGPKVESLCKLPNGQILAATERGFKYIEKDDDGEYDWGSNLKGSYAFNYAFKGGAEEMVALPNGDVIARGGGGGCMLLRAGLNVGLDELKKKLSKIANKASASN